VATVTAGRDLAAPVATVTAGRDLAAPVATVTAGRDLAAPVATVTAGPRRVRRGRWPLVALALVAAPWLLAACPDEAPPTCVDRLCEAGAQRCFDNSAATCAPGGGAWVLSSCGASMRCDQGVCKQRACANLLAGTCDDDSTASVCSATGDAVLKDPCALSEICRGGECVPATCPTDGATRCAAGTALLTCVSGAWGVTACPVGHVCQVEAGAASCQPRACEPQQARCVDGQAALCDPQGRAETTTACASNEACADGYCQPKVCAATVAADATAADATGDVAADTGPAEDDVYIPPLEEPSKVDFAIAGQFLSFDLNPRADYIAPDQSLKISAAKGAGRKIEINIAPIDPLTVGLWNESDGTDVTVVICYFDGVTAGEVSPCPVGFSHTAIAYVVDIAANNGPFSRVKGTFSATLKDSFDNQVSLTDGVFNVQHK
jgi:hypothetical protein